MTLTSQVVQKAWVSLRTKAFHQFVTRLRDKSGYFPQEFWPLQTARAMLLQILNQAVLSSKNRGFCRSSQWNFESFKYSQRVYNPLDIQSERQFPKKRGQKQQQSWKSKNIYVQIAPPSSHTVHSLLRPILSFSLAPF